MGKSSLQPGKGVFLHLNEDTLTFVASAVSDLTEHFGEDLDEALEADKGAELFKQFQAAEVDGWSFTKDNFGKKLYKSLPWREGEIRVTLILNSSDELKLDIRSWF